MIDAFVDMTRVIFRSRTALCSWFDGLDYYSSGGVDLTTNDWSRCLKVGRNCSSRAYHDRQHFFRVLQKPQVLY